VGDLRSLSRRTRAAESGIIDDLFQLTQERVDLVSFAAGAPDTALLPVELLDELTSRAVAHFGRAVLQYGHTLGFPPLREAVLPLLAARGLSRTSADVHIATGGSGALNNVCMALLDEGDVVAVERPTYSPALKVLAAYGARVVDVDCDEHGLLPDALDAVLAAQPVKVLYTLPTFQNPTGRTMPAERRAAVAAVVARHDTFLVEDDVYYDLRFRGDDVPALSSLLPDRSVYLTSFSKLFAPAVRTGVAVMPPDVLAGVLKLKQGIDMQTSSYTQALVTEFVTSGWADKHREVLRIEYGRRLAVLDRALGAHLPAGFRWAVPDGGMFVWVEGPPTLDAMALLRPAVEAGVAFVPGAAFFVTPAHAPHTLRLSFASVPEDHIEEGVRRLAAVLAPGRGGSR
jgi:2-aminoadipate transaminase